MAKIKINREKCKGCLLCISFCQKGAIIVDPALNKRGVKPVKFKENSQCLGCTMCALVCPDCCIEVYK
ncbi:MAG: 4Fe-4S binding protein [Candidatus Omnitrophica bacterium]|nr:4Fe-4S binding protein [Candidatus Omnitrophota bacterium]